MLNLAFYGMIRHEFGGEIMEKLEKSNIAFKKDILCDKIALLPLNKELMQFPDKRWIKYAHHIFTHLTIPMEVTEESLKNMMYKFLKRLPNPMYLEMYEKFLEENQVIIKREMSEDTETTKKQDNYEVEKDIILSLKQDYADYTNFAHEIGHKITENLDDSLHVNLFRHVIPFYFEMLFIYFYSRTPIEFYQILSGLELKAYDYLTKIHFQELAFKKNRQKLETEMEKYGLNTPEYVTQILHSSYYDNIMDFHSLMIDFDLLYRTMKNFEEGFDSFDSMVQESYNSYLHFMEKNWITYLGDGMESYNYFLEKTDKALSLVGRM